MAFDRQQIPWNANLVERQCGHQTRWSRPVRIMKTEGALGSRLSSSPARCPDCDDVMQMQCYLRGAMMIEVKYSDDTATARWASVDLRWSENMRGMLGLASDEGDLDFSRPATSAG